MFTKRLEQRDKLESGFILQSTAVLQWSAVLCSAVQCLLLITYCWAVSLISLWTPQRVQDSVQQWMMELSLPDGTELNHENEIWDSVPDLQPIRGQSWIRPGELTNQARPSARSRVLEVVGGGNLLRISSPHQPTHQNTCCSPAKPSISTI